MDDHALIQRDYLTRNLKLLPNVFERSLFSSSSFYRPLFQVFLMVEYFFFKSNVFGYHLVNIIIHFINCLLFFKLINFIFGDYNLSLLSTFLFAIHPIHNTVINTCAASDVLLVSLFMLLSLTSFIKFSKSNKLKFSYLSIIFFIIALFFRESAILLPFYLTCLIFFYFKRNDFKKYFYLILIFLVCGLGYFLLRLTFFSLKESIFNELTKSFTFLEYISGFLHLLLLYLNSIVIPKGIVWIWSISSQKNLFNAEVVVFTLFSLLVVYIAMRYWKRSAKSFAIVWFLIGALSTILMISSKGVYGDLIMEPQWFYFSSFGIFLFASIFLLKLKKYINSKLWFCLIFSILLFYCSETRAYNVLWRDAKTYYKYWLSVSPNNSIRINLANIYVEEGKYKEAESLYREAFYDHNFFIKKGKFFININQLSYICNNMGILYYYKLGRANDGLKMFNKAIEIDPSNSLPYLNRANIFLEKDKLNEAISDYERSVAINPDILEAHYNLAILYARLNKEDKAIEEYLKATTLDENCFKNSAVNKSF